MPPHSLPGFYEPFSAISHLLGAVVFAVLGVRLLRAARGQGLRLFFYGVYVFAGTFLLSMSGVYHMLAEGSTGRAVLGRLDQAAIFALIAGTFTPVQGLFFRGWVRWLPLFLMWAGVATGIPLFSVFYHEMPGYLGSIIYLAMGWLAGLSSLLAWRRVGWGEVRLLLTGGLVYSIGATIMGIKWPTLIPGVVGPHDLWHVAVLIAMTMHWRFLYAHAQTDAVGPVRTRT